MTKGILLDNRDKPLLHRLIISFVLVFPSAIYMLWSEFSIPKALIYILAVVAPQMAPYSCYIHTVIHRGIFKKTFSFINHLHYWTVGIFLGETPYTHYTHHIGMHHPENNSKGDVSTTIIYQRDRFFDFARYYYRFLFLGGVVLPYLARKRRYKFFKITIFGEGAFVAIVAIAIYLNPMQALTVFVAPLVILRTGMACVNWSQHAFVDTNDLNNNYRICTTIIESSYNKKCFNDAYHIEHHSYPRAHWSELPLLFEKNRALYTKYNAIVFRKIDYLQIFFLLMMKQYGILARYYVDLSGTLSMTEIESLLRERTRVAQSPANESVGLGLSAIKLYPWKAARRADA